MPETVGIELEVGRKGEHTARILKALRLTSHETPHAKHCDCEHCDPFASAPFYVQHEVGGAVEFISKVHEYPSEELERAIDGLTTALHIAGARASSLDGLDVHVGRDGYKAETLAHLVSLVARHQDELAALAAGEFASVRQDDASERYADIDGRVYKLDRDGARFLGHEVPRRAVVSVSAVWVHARPTTVEWRLWSATTEAWRLRLAIGVSVAFMRAAKDGAEAATLPELVGPYMSDEVWELLQRQATTDTNRKTTPLPSPQEIALQRQREQFATMLDTGYAHLE